MGSLDADFVIGVALGLFVITSPVDPVKLLLFNDIVARQQRDRAAAAFQRTVYVTIILAIATLIGKELL